MAIVGPWAIAVYGDKVNWGAVPVPTSAGTSPEETYTFSDAKNIGLYSACENQGTAWEVLKFATSEEQDGQLLELTGQMPLRTDLPGTYPDYFAENPSYRRSPTRPSRTVEVPNVPNSIEIWQEFRDAYTESVIFGEEPVDEALSAGAADEATDARRPVLSEHRDDHDQRRPRGRVPAGHPRRPARRLAALLGRQPLGMLFAAPYAVFLAAGVRLPARARGVDQLPRLLLRRARRRGGPAVRRARQLPGGARRPGRPAVVPQRPASSSSSTCR